jgi:DNA-binding response OmpR family regulator
LLDSIWGVNAESGEETIKTHISRIRNRLKDLTEFNIVTIKGLGYKADIRQDDAK